jgi:hypothetical protein
MPMETPTPAASPNKPDDSTGGMDHSRMGGMPGMGGTSSGAGMKMGGPVVMSGDEMSVRVGASETNLLPVGRMGSGTSWQPASSPVYMLDWVKGEWLLMLHGEAKVGVNSQGGRAA